MADELEFIQSMSVLSMQPGDIVVLKTDRVLSRDQMDIIQNHFQSKIHGHEVIVLSGGLDIGVLRNGGGTTEVQG